MSMARLTEISESQTTVFNAKRTTTLQEELFINGFAFTARDVITAPAATNLYIHLDATVVTDKQIVFNPLQFLAASAGPVLITYYVVPTLTAGGRTPIVGSNRRSTSTNTSDVILEFVAPANVTSPGTKFSAQIIPSNSGGGALPDSGNTTSNGLPFEIKNSIEYVIEIDNTNGEDTLFEYNVDWFESPTG